MPDDRTAVKQHRIELNNRKTLLITGVKDVHSFDEQEILLETELGILLIRGSKLHIDRLSIERGETDVDGRIDSLIYTELKGHTKNGETWLKRMFR